MKDTKIDLNEVEWAESQAEKLGTKYYGRGAFLDADFTWSDGWDNAVTALAYLNHRIPELHAWLYYQFKKSADPGWIDVRTLMYKMTTRATNKPYYRGNLNFDFHNFKEMKSLVSPDSMWQAVQPSDFIGYVRNGAIPIHSDRIQFRIACNFDGPSNDGWEHSTWEVFPVSAVKGDEIVDKEFGNPRIVVEKFFKKWKDQQGK